MGDPLARPFAKPTLNLADDGTLNVITSRLEPGRKYELRASDTQNGTYTVVKTISLTSHAKTTISVPGATHPFYTLVDTTDTKLPTGSILSPADGAVITGDFEVELRGGTDPALKAMLVSVDGTVIPRVVTSTVGVDATQLSDGVHTITARFIDNSENVTERTIHITMAKHLDTTPPNVVFTSPAPGTIIDYHNSFSHMLLSRRKSGG